VVAVEERTSFVVGSSRVGRQLGHKDRIGSVVIEEVALHHHHHHHLPLLLGLVAQYYYHHP